MNELKMRRVESDASNSPFQLFGWIVLPVADDRVADRGQLNADLILQSGHQRDSEERCVFKAMFHGIAKLSASRFWISFCSHPLKHSLLSKVMNECPFFQAEMTANCREIFPHRSVPDKLLNECFSIWPSFCKEQNPRCLLIDSMDDKRPLPL